MLNNVIPKKILVCPLNWGLGHATRMIPIIRVLLQTPHQIVLAGEGDSLHILREEFPQLQAVVFPSYRIRFSKRNSQVFRMLINIPKILMSILHEHFKVKQLVKIYDIDVIISDNRFGLWNKAVYSIFVTHQIAIQMPKGCKFFEHLLYHLNCWFIKHYDQCWIPDSAGATNLSGNLSHQFPAPANAKFIGILSRFEMPEVCTNIFEYDIVVLLSGPEPQRSLLEKILVEQIAETEFKTLIIRGLPKQSFVKPDVRNISFVNHLRSQALSDAILKGNIVICRSGYSTIMDLVTLRKRAILIPTPGQTEQEYLARHLKNGRLYYSVSQSEFNLQVALFELPKYAADIGEIATAVRFL